MATDTEPTSLQTGTTPNPIASNAQDFSGSDDEILDNFADGPLPDDAETHDDGVPMGLGGEKGKQSEPASSTLEADIVNGTLPDNKKLPEETAGDPEPVQDAGEEGSEEMPEPEEEEPEGTPEFPLPLLQMANLADADAAKAAGFETPEALFAAIKWRGQLLAPGAQPAQPSGEGLYQRTAAPTAPPAEPKPAPEAEAKAFELPAEKMDLLDEDLQDVIRQMHDHYEQEMTSLRSTISQREADLARQQEHDESVQFDELVQTLGDWKDVFGEGSGADLARASQSDPVAMTHFNHRTLLFDTVQAVREVNAKQGYKSMSLDQEVQWALMQRYPDKFQQTISGNSKPRGPRRGVTASRPTQRKTPVTAKDKLLRDLHKKYPDAGFTKQDEEEFAGEI